VRQEGATTIVTAVKPANITQSILDITIQISITGEQFCAKHRRQRGDVHSRNGHSCQEKLPDKITRDKQKQNYYTVVNQTRRKETDPWPNKEGSKNFTHSIFRILGQVTAILVEKAHQYQAMNE
jgi:hypothetical protein